MYEAFGAGEQRDRGGDFLGAAVAAERGRGLQGGGEVAAVGFMSVSIGPGCTSLTAIPRGTPRHVGSG
jgi:hypothetical protein